MSEIAIVGNSRLACSRLFEGDDEIELPNASTAMTKNFELSAIPSGEMKSLRSAVWPENYVGKRIAFERSALSVPKVR